jgi:predicted NBD/HSP70 family sugar kinase
MAMANSLGQLLTLRAIDGAAHLPAVTLLMVAASRAEGTRRGATLRRLAGGDPAAVDAEVVFAAAAEGDRAALGIVDDRVGHLARGVAAVAAVVDPSVVVIGGGLSRAGEPLRARLERDVRRLLPRPPRIVLSALGEDGVALGAVTAAIGEWEAMAYAAPIEA